MLTLDSTKYTITINTYIDIPFSTVDESKKADTPHKYGVYRLFLK